MKIALACSGHIGHLNPMLAVARALVDLGHDVHFRSMEGVRAKIEGAGATFHNAVLTQPEYYAGRELAGPLGALEDVMNEHKLDSGSFLSQLRVYNIALEQQLPGAVRFLRELRPAVVVYDGIMTCRDLMFAAKVLKIPAVAVWSLAGPGAWVTHSAATMLPLTLAEADSLVANFTPHADAVERINRTYGLELCKGLPQPAGKVDTFDADAVLITTSADLQDPMTPELKSAYEKDGANFVYVGPLLTDGAGASESTDDEVVQRVRSARAQGRPVVLVSMGTLLVSDHQLNGWDGRSGGSSLTGSQLCRAAWGGTFDAFGSSSANEGALLVVSLGPRPKPLGDLAAPPNALCVSYVNQQRILEVGVDVFLTHGGQNSFTEAMMYATPVVVCPGFGDQVVNSNKAVTLGVGLKVDRPQGDCDQEGAVALKYRADVHQALLQVRAEQQSFVAAAKNCAARLRKTGGIPSAVRVVLSTAVGGGALEDIGLSARSPKGVSERAALPLQGAVAVAGA